MNYYKWDNARQYEVDCLIKGRVANLRCSRPHAQAEWTAEFSYIDTPGLISFGRGRTRDAAADAAIANYATACAPTPVPAPKTSEGEDIERRISVWRFHDAPAELQELSPHGGDEDWLAEVPAVVHQSHYLGWMESGTAFGVCQVSEHGHPSKPGWRVFIGAHS